MYSPHATAPESSTELEHLLSVEQDILRGQQMYYYQDRPGPGPKGSPEGHAHHRETSTRQTSASVAVGAVPLGDPTGAGKCVR
jgi:hypothetical protein